jgi:predicted DsbA family dithiol-disulfide isomerase
MAILKSCSDGVEKEARIMTVTLDIDFVSDVVCPWCIIGLGGLEDALGRIEGVSADIRFHPFELNPGMPSEGENVAEHIARKYGASPEQSSASRDAIRARAADIGFAIKSGPEARIWNTFDAHRLLHWAGTLGGNEQRTLKHALFTAHFSEGRNIADHAVLADVAASAGFDGNEASAILASDRYAADVRAAEDFWRKQGVQAVPTLVIDGRYLISGGQTAEVFERALRRIAAERAAAG